MSSSFLFFPFQMAIRIAQQRNGIVIKPRRQRYRPKNVCVCACVKLSFEKHLLITITNLTKERLALFCFVNNEGELQKKGVIIIVIIFIYIFVCFVCFLNRKEH